MKRQEINVRYKPFDVIRFLEYNRNVLRDMTEKRFLFSSTLTIFRKQEEFS